MVWDSILLPTVTSYLWSCIFLDTFLSHIRYFISITVAINAGNFALHTNVDHFHYTSRATHKRTHFKIFLLSLCTFLLQQNSKPVMVNVHLEQLVQFVGMRYWSSSYIYIYIYIHIDCDPVFLQGSKGKIIFLLIHHNFLNVHTSPVIIIHS